MTTTSSRGQELVSQKLASFKRLQPEFEECFQFVQDVHGQQRLSSFPASDIVRYLHALWICECKDRLLSVYKNIQRYDGPLCLDLMRKWQEEQDSASIVAFLYRKLDMLPLADITYRIHEAQRMQQDNGLAQRLIHGRQVLLNRGMNLMAALDMMFTLSEEALLREVSAACKKYGHTPTQIEQQVAELDSPLYAYVPHQALAQCNMQEMNKLGLKVTAKPGDLPGQRSWRVMPSTEESGPYAEHVVEGYQQMLSPWHNNLNAHRFVDRPESSSPEGTI